MFPRLGALRGVWERLRQKGDAERLQPLVLVGSLATSQRTYSDLSSVPRISHSHMQADGAYGTSTEDQLTWTISYRAVSVALVLPLHHAYLLLRLLIGHTARFQQGCTFQSSRAVSAQGGCGTAANVH